MYIQTFTLHTVHDSNDFDTIVRMRRRKAEASISSTARTSNSPRDSCCQHDSRSKFIHKSHFCREVSKVLIIFLVKNEG